jgi:hypothetical protein
MGPSNSQAGGEAPGAAGAAGPAAAPSGIAIRRIIEQGEPRRAVAASPAPARPEWESAIPNPVNDSVITGAALPPIGNATRNGSSAGSTSTMGAAPSTTAPDWRNQPPSRFYPEGVPQLRPEFMHQMPPQSSR